MFFWSNGFLIIFFDQTTVFRFFVDQIAFWSNNIFFWFLIKFFLIKRLFDQFLLVDEMFFWINVLSIKKYFFFWLNVFLIKWFVDQKSVFSCFWLNVFFDQMVCLIEVFYQTNSFWLFDQIVFWSNNFFVDWLNVVWSDVFLIRWLFDHFLCFF